MRLGLLGLAVAALCIPVAPAGAALVTIAIARLGGRSARRALVGGVIALLGAGAMTWAVRHVIGAGYPTVAAWPTHWIYAPVVTAFFAVLAYLDHGPVSAEVGSSDAPVPPRAA